MLFDVEKRRGADAHRPAVQPEGTRQCAQAECTGVTLEVQFEERRLDYHDQLECDPVDHPDAPPLSVEP